MKLFSRLLISTLIISSILYSSANAQQFNINAQISPIKSYTVYASQSYTLSVTVQYNIDPKTESNIGPISLYVYSPPYSSSKVQVSGTGSRTLTLPLVAPTQPGSYTLGIKLQADSKQAQGELIDTATVNYNVIMPVENDWAVNKVWITPDSPSPGDEVTFHATIALKSTTGQGTQIATVGCFLNDRPFGQTQLLSFQYPSSQDISAPLEWTAEEGSYRLRFAVEDFNRYQDKFIQDNIRDYVFSIEPFFAMINGTFIDPSPVYSGESFTASVYVTYSFPESAQLRIRVTFPIPAFNYTSEQILSMNVTDETYDSVSGMGNKPYIFTLNAPVVTFSSASSPGPDGILGTADDILNATQFIGMARVEFDRETGSGWENTDPGFFQSFIVDVMPPRYYAIINIAELTYLGEVSPFDPNNPKGKFRANIEVEYFLPEEDAKLRLMLTESKGTKIYDGTSGAKGEGKRTYPVEFELPLDMEIKDYTELFNVEASYEVDEEWYSGDSRSSSAPVSISEEAIGAKPGAPSGSAFEPVTDFFNSIADFFRGLFGLQNPWIYGS
ncbi:hypothetical protein [[Eubacterium] cellulosolvens]